MFSKTSYTESQQAFPAHRYADATKHHSVERLEYFDSGPQPKAHLLQTFTLYYARRVSPAHSPQAL